MAITLYAECRSCGCPISIDAGEYSEEGEYAYWYPTEAAQDADHYGAGDCYCPDHSTEPHQPGDILREEDDGYREVNLSAEARALIARQFNASPPANQGVRDEVWLEIQSAFPE